MFTEAIPLALSKGAEIYASVSGGKDGQAMVKSLVDWQLPITGLIHADLGRVEWPQSMDMCRNLSEWHDIPLHTVTRSDGLDLLGLWQKRMLQLKGTGKPFWSSATNRYCTSDMKRATINKFFTSRSNFIISAEGIRAAESTKRASKIPLEIRREKTSSYYRNMNVLQAIEHYRPDKRLTLTWFPIFNYTTEEVWNTYGMTGALLVQARASYKTTGIIPEWWPFHPAYAMGNDRVSCMICILGCMGDLQNGAQHNPSLLQTMIAMEDEGQASFKHNWSLRNLLTA
ncbi:phosphoadenosine phosphosulfate reductase family protein [Chitinophaga sp. CC14]|uniref:phosphoadenosine phosphosulfate reductase domain-containing protein n=1 Tax=Chitinophaga sp. CC14 TaxID=3029199 RepID=UPI003B7D0909